MAARVGLLLRALPLLLWGGLDARLAERAGQELRREAEAFLERYGYLSEQASESPSWRFSNAIREFQWVSQLPVSGVLDPATLRQMARPRCGVADTDGQAAWTERDSALFAGRRAKMRRKRFAKQALSKHNSHTIQFTHRERAVQGFQRVCRAVQPSSRSNSRRTSSSPQTESPGPLAVTPHAPPTPPAQLPVTVNLFVSMDLSVLNIPS
ncbi:matrix metalloproteinase-28 isoform 3-T3 [Glossophaga mutica]